MAINQLESETLQVDGIQNFFLPWKVLHGRLYKSMGGYTTFFNLEAQWLMCLALEPIANNGRMIKTVYYHDLYVSMIT